MTRFVLCCFLVASSLALLACNSKSQPSPSAKSATDPSAAKVARIVFLGQAQACPCTEKRIAETREALTTALAGTELPVDRFDIDVDPELAEPYEELKAYMVMPALYLLDKDGNLLEMMQGELSVEQLSNALRR